LSRNFDKDTEERKDALMNSEEMNVADLDYCEAVYEDKQPGSDVEMLPEEEEDCLSEGSVYNDTPELPEKEGYQSKGSVYNDTPELPEKEGCRSKGSVYNDTPELPEKEGCLSKGSVYNDTPELPVKDCLSEGSVYNDTPELPEKEGCLSKGSVYNDTPELPEEDCLSEESVCNDTPQTSKPNQTCQQTIENLISKEQAENMKDSRSKENSDFKNTESADFHDENLSQNSKAMTGQEQSKMDEISSQNRPDQNKTMTGQEQIEKNKIFHNKKQTKKKDKSEIVKENGQKGDTNLSESLLTETCMEKETEERRKSDGHDCLFCDKKLKTRKILLRHVVIHVGKRRRCSLCGKMCNKKDDLKTHLKNHHSEKIRLLKASASSGIKRKRKPKSATKKRVTSSGEEKSKTCQLCKVEFSTSHGLNRHMVCHQKLKVFKCYVCSKNFHTQVELASHMSVHEMTLVYSCHGCGLGCDSWESLQRHKKNSGCSALEAEEVASFKCTICDKIFIYQRNFEKHLEYHEAIQNSGTESTVFKNDTKTSVDRSELSAHSKNDTETSVDRSGLDAHSKKSLYSDVVIKKESETNSTDNLEKANTGFEFSTIISKVPKSTTETSKSTPDLVCDLCGQIFKKAMNLYRHKLDHDNTSMFPCRFCNFVTKTKDNLTRHSKKHLAQLPHVCQICDRGFTEKCNLTFHMQSHSADKQFLCDDCGKAFRARNSLLVHKRVHIGNRPYKCKHCQQTFTTNSTRKEHEKLHMNKKSYMCDVCGSSFNQRCGLYTHKLTHHNGDPAQICTDCGRAFKTQNHLRVHFVAKHLKLEDVESFGFKVYVCEVCQKLFSDKCDLNSHMNKHTGLLYTCITM
jgi:KRAB domain-containing zinc finger protein